MRGKVHATWAQRNALPISPRSCNAFTICGGAQVKARCLVAIAKVLQHGTAEQLQTLLVDVPLASFVAALLRAREASTLAAALRLAELLIGKLPELYRRAFRREGVVHALEQLAAGAPPPPSAAAKGKERERQAAPKRSSTRAKVRAGGLGLWRSYDSGCRVMLHTCSFGHYSSAVKAKLASRARTPRVSALRRRRRRLHRSQLRRPQQRRLSCR